MLLLMMTGTSPLLLISSITLGWKGEDMLEERKLFLQGVVYYCKEEMEEKDTEEDATDDNEMKEGELEEDDMEDGEIVKQTCSHEVHGRCSCMM